MLIRQTGGLEGLRDENLLDSALNAPYQTFGGEAPLYYSGTGLNLPLGFICWSRLTKLHFQDVTDKLREFLFYNFTFLPITIYRNEKIISVSDVFYLPILT